LVGAGGRESWGQFRGGGYERDRRPRGGGRSGGGSWGGGAGSGGYRTSDMSGGVSLLPFCLAVVWCLSCVVHASVLCGACICLVWCMHVSSVVHACVECGACMCLVAHRVTLLCAPYAAHVMLPILCCAPHPLLRRPVVWIMRRCCACGMWHVAGRDDMSAEDLGWD